jgi:hypothetical protein
MSSGPELPTIYENPRFDKATPTLQPVINRSVRFGAVMMMEWGTLTLIEDSPRYLKFATIAVAGLVLGVHESWPWLRMRDWRWYPSLMFIFVTGYFAIFAYALYTEPAHKSTSDEIATAVVKALPHQAPQSGTFNEAVPQPAAPPRSKQAINELLDESGAISSIIEKSGLPLINEWRESITTQNPERICTDIDSRALQDKITTLANKLGRVVI